MKTWILFRNSDLPVHVTNETISGKVHLEMEFRYRHYHFTDSGMAIAEVDHARADQDRDDPSWH